MSWKNKPLFCRTCEAHQVKTEIYFDNEHKSQTGKSIPMEKASRQPHQCQFSPYAMKQQQQGFPPKYNPQQQKEFMDTYAPQPQEQHKITSPYEQLPPEAQKFIAEPQNYGEYFRTLETKLDKMFMAIDVIHDMIVENNPTAADNAKLRERIRQLEESLANHEKTFVPANKVQNPKGESDGIVKSYPDIEPEAMAAEAENEHVRRVMKKGEEDEELEI